MDQLKSDPGNARARREELFVQAYLQAVACRMAVSALSNRDLNAVMSEAIGTVTAAMDSDAGHIVEFAPDGSPIVRAGTRSTRPPWIQGASPDRVKVPIDGRIGSVGALEIRPHQTPSVEEMQFLRCVASIIGSAMQRYREEETLRQSERRSRLLIDALKECSLISLDPEGRILSWNPGAEHLWGHAADEVLGRHVTWLYAPVGRRAEDPNPAQPTRLGRLRFGGWFKNGQGSKFFAEVSVSPMRDVDRLLLGFSHVTLRTQPSRKPRNGDAVPDARTSHRPHRRNGTSSM
jgi:PAS domain S-box-containing protein